MSFQNISRPLILLMTALIVFSLDAQQLHESISVEGKYVPDVIKIDKMYAFPKRVKGVLESSPLRYDENGVTASFMPLPVTMQATGWCTSRRIDDSRGYLEFAAGSYLNSNLSAGYRFMDNASTLAGIRLQHNSTSLFRPEIEGVASATKQYRYDESVALYVSHFFKGTGRLDASLDFHPSFFNYYGFRDFNDSEKKAPAQTLNDISFRLDWRSPLRAASNSGWYASGTIRNFAFSSLPLPSAPGNTYGACRETDVALRSGVKIPWDNGSSIVIDAILEMLFYNAGNYFGVDNYSLLTLNPYYRFTKGLLDIRIGADIDLAFKAGESGNRYPLFHIAPDLRFGLQAEQVGIYLNLTGETTLNTLAHLHELDYYSLPALTSTRPTHTPLDAAVGINFGPFSGFSAGVEGRFRSSRNVTLGGWYQAWLDYGSSPVPGLNPKPSPGVEMNYCSEDEGININGVSLKGMLKYDQGKYFSILAEGTWQPGEGKKGFFNGYDRPEITGSIKICINPISPLSINTGFDFRGGRKIYVKSTETLLSGNTLINGTEKTLHSLSLSNVSLLNLGASWSFNDHLSVMLQADNLLNRHYDILPLQPSQGIIITGGLKWLFR